MALLHHFRPVSRFNAEMMRDRAIVLSCIVSENLVENRDFFEPLTFDALVRGSPSEYCYPVWYGKTRMVWPPDGEKTFMICLTASTKYRRVTDRQTNGRTDRHLAIA